MPHLIRRTVEEVYAADDEAAAKLDDMNDAEVEEDEAEAAEEDERPAKRKRRP